MSRVISARERSATEALHEEYFKTRDTRVRNRLVVVWEKLVYKISNSYAHKGTELDDLVQVGFIGLIKALDRFDPGKGFKFSTFAVPSIHGEIKRYFRNSGSNIRPPGDLKDQFRRIQWARERLEAREARQVSTVELGKYCGLTEEAVTEVLAVALYADHVSLDEPVCDDRMGRSVVLSETLGGEDLGIMRLEREMLLKQAMQHLDERQRLIVYFHFFSELSQREAGRRLGLSQTQVSRALSRALKDMRRFME